MYLGYVGLGRYGIMECSKTPNQNNSLCKYGGIPIGTSVYNDQHRLPSLSVNLI